MFSNKYISDLGTVKRYGTNENTYKYKLTHMSVCRQKGIEDEKKYTPKGKGNNEHKLENNISRTRSKVFEIASCNTWELFVTFTLDKSKYDRNNLKKFSKDIAQFIRDYKKKYGCNIKYMLIPEKHKDGAWHMHGFLQGLPVEHLTQFNQSQRLPAKILNRLKQGKQVFTWSAYANKFGYADIEQIENPEAVSKYITKYVTEDLQRTITELNAHMYYCSKGLKTAEIVKKDVMTYEIKQPDYKNEYVSVKWFEKFKDTIKYFEDGVKEIAKSIDKLCNNSIYCRPTNQRQQPENGYIL